MVLAAYAEPLVDGRRAIVFGDSSSGMAEHLLERGARLVHVYDPDATRVAEAATKNTSRNVSYGPLAEGALAVRDGAFDVGFVENLAEVGDPSSALKRLRHALSPRGVALIALPNPDISERLLASPGSGELDYYRLYDLTAEQFDHVRMLGQAPFVGYAVADFSAGGVPEPALDSAFVPGGAEEPEWFVALASSISIHLDEFAVVQLPFRQALPAAQTRELEAELARARAAEHRAREHSAALEADRNHAARQQEQLAASRVDRERVEALEGQLTKRDAWIQELETRLTIADARADEAQAELEEQRERARRAPEPSSRPARPDADSRRQVEGLRRELDALKRELDSVLTDRDRARQRASELEAMVAERDAKIAELESRESASEEDPELARLEAQLYERGAEIRKLQSDMREAERLGRELLTEIEVLREAPPSRPGELEAKLDELAAQNALREADLAAARWSIEALESRLLDVDGGDRKKDLEQALARAEARVQEQATLIEQLRGGV